MTLEDTLYHVKFIDELVLRQYTKIGRKFDLTKGRKKYFIGTGLWVMSSLLKKDWESNLIGPNLSLPTRLVLNLPTLPDWIYNFCGITGHINEETADAKSVDPIAYLCNKFNSGIRLPIFLSGAGLVGNFGVDIFNHITQGRPLEAKSLYCLQYGMGLLSLASSMYIKEVDPKLLEKESFLKKAYNWVKEGFDSLTPKPLPQPVPVKLCYNLEERIN